VGRQSPRILYANKKKPPPSSVKSESVSVASKPTTASLNDSRSKKLDFSQDDSKSSGTDDVNSSDFSTGEVEYANKLSIDSPEDGKLAANALTIKNMYERKLFTLAPREGSKIASNVWKEQYALMVSLSAKGKEMIKKKGKTYSTSTYNVLQWC
jgi:hypothetical protein